MNRKDLEHISMHMTTKRENRWLYYQMKQTLYKNYEQQMKIVHINKKFNTRGYRNRNIDIHSEFSLKVTEVKDTTILT